MRRQVPNDIDVVLEEAEIYARGIVIVKLAEGAIVDELTDALDGPGEEKGVIHHDLQVLAFRELDEFFGLGGRGGKRLLDEYVLAIFKSGLRQFVVSPNGRDYSDQVDVGRGDQLVAVMSANNRRVSTANAL